MESWIWTARLASTHILNLQTQLLQRIPYSPVTIETLPGLARIIAPKHLALPARDPREIPIGGRNITTPAATPRTSSSSMPQAASPEAAAAPAPGHDNAAE